MYAKRPVCLCKANPDNPFDDSHSANSCKFVFTWESEAEMNRARNALNGRS